MLTLEEIKILSVRSHFLHELEETNYNSEDKERIYNSEVYKRLSNSNYKVFNNLNLFQNINKNKSSNSICIWYEYICCSLNKSNQSNSDYYKYSPFAQVLFPFLESFEEGLNKILFENKIKKSEDISKSSIISLLKKLSNMTAPTLYTDYHIYCNEIKQEPSEDAFHQWENEMISNRWYSVLYKYPVLGRFIYELIINYSNHLQEIFFRLQKDRKKLEQDFLISSNLSIIDIQLDMSDSHNFSRTVSRLFFDNGKTLIYKPKSLHNEKWFMSYILPKINEILPCIAGYKVLDYGEYGWAEDIDYISGEKNKDNLSNQEIILTAFLFYLLNATDLHAENIIKKNGKIFIVDYETILNSPIRSTFNKYKDSYKAWNIFSTEMLQHKFSRNLYMNRGNGFSGDIAFAPFRKPNFFYSKSKGVEVSISDPEDISYQNINNKAEDTDNLDDIDISTIKNHAAKLLEEIRYLINSNKNILMKANDCKIRYLLRDTMFYERLSQRIFQPKLLKSGVDMSLDLYELFLPLTNYAEDECNNLAPLIFDEILQTLNGDIPLFWHKANMLDLQSQNGEVKKCYFKEIGIKTFADKIDKLCGTDIEEQIRLAEASISFNHNKQQNYNFDKNINFTQKVINICVNYSENIIGRAIFKQDRHAQWISFSMDPKGETMFPSVADDSFYSGYWGILFFISSTLMIAKENLMLSSFLQREGNYWKKNIMYFDSYTENIGLSGAGGCMISLAQLYKADNSAAWIQMAFETLIDALDRSGEESDDKYFDVLGGGAGLLLGITSILNTNLYQTISSKTIFQLRKLSQRAINNIIEHATTCKIGKAWLSKDGEKKPLLGFAHGASGIISALNRSLLFYELLDLDNQTIIRAKSIILEAMLYIKAHKASDGHWIDLRNNNEHINTNNSWCHGNSGIGLSLLSNKLMSTDEKNIELFEIFEAIKKNPEVTHYYCCGQAGSLDFLIEMNKVYPSNEALNFYANSMAEKLYNQLATGNFFTPLGMARSEHFLGLFQGVTGILYTLLRFCNKTLPSLYGTKI